MKPTGEIFVEWEHEKLLNAPAEEYSRFLLTFRLIVLLCLRLEEIPLLRYDNMVYENGKAKSIAIQRVSGKVVEFPLTDLAIEAIAWLRQDHERMIEAKEWRTDLSCDFICVSDTLKPYSTRTIVEKWNRINGRCFLNIGLTPFTSLREAGISILRKSDMTEDEIKRLLGE